MKVGDKYPLPCFKRSTIEEGNYVGDWQTNTDYAVDDVVTYSGVKYICDVSHRSGVFLDDVAAGKWSLYFPNRSYLIGWYKNNEGSGEVVYNYAIKGTLGGGLLVHLDIFSEGDLEGYTYWDFPDFGHLYNVSVGHQFAYNYVVGYFSERNFNNLNFGQFIKRNTNNTSNYAAGNAFIYETDEDFKLPLAIGLMWIGEPIVLNTITTYDEESILIQEFENAPNKWYFQFFTNNRLHIVDEDGNLQIMSDPINASSFLANSLMLNYNSITQESWCL